MSYTIEYSRKAFYLPKGTAIPEGYGKSAHELWEDEIFLFVKAGCNNVYPRPKTWGLVCFGWNFSVVAEVCKMAGYTEGGSIKLNGKDTTPENYLSLYRKTLAQKEELTVENLKAWGVSHFELAIGPKELAEYHQSNLEVLKAKSIDCTKRYDKYDVYSIALTDMDSIILLMNVHYLSRESDGWFSIVHNDNS